MTIREFAEKSRWALKTVYDLQESGAIVRVLLRERLNLSPAALAVRADEVLTAAQQRSLGADLQRLITGEPLQYVVGHTWFSGLQFSVGAGVLIPRPETEELVEYIAQDSAPASILDVCTGSGCIALALKHKFSEARVTGCDVSEEALNLARRDALNLSLDVSFFEADVLSEKLFEVGAERFACIVSNPPYIRTSEGALMHDNVLRFEPSIALFAPEEDPLMFFRKIGAIAHRHLSDNGTLWFELNQYLAEDTRNLLLSMGFGKAELLQDMSGAQRFLKVQR